MLNWREIIAFREIIVDHVLIWWEHTVFREIITVQITVCAKLAGTNSFKGNRHSSDHVLNWREHIVFTEIITVLIMY